MSPQTQPLLDVDKTETIRAVFIIRPVLQLKVCKVLLSAPQIEIESENVSVL